MNRVIKFRAWAEGQMWSWVTLECTKPLVWSEMDAVMQFTGLLDKNGLEIYEGDLILLDEDWAKMISASRTLCKVGFAEGAFMIGRHELGPHGMDTYLWLCNKHCSVVGNVYQTPTWDAPQETGKPS